MNLASPLLASAPGDSKQIQNGLWRTKDRHLRRDARIISHDVRSFSERFAVIGKRFACVSLLQVCIGAERGHPPSRLRNWWRSRAISPDVLDRTFEAPSANRKWVADFTYIWTVEGWLYGAAVLYLFFRRMVGWSMSATMTAQGEWLRRRLDRKAISEPNYAICSKAGKQFRSRLLSDGTPTTGYLLFSKLPHPCHPERRVALWSGNTGPATEAVRLLFNALSENDVENLAALEGTKYF